MAQYTSSTVFPSCSKGSPDRTLIFNIPNFRCPEFSARWIRWVDALEQMTSDFSPVPKTGSGRELTTRTQLRLFFHSRVDPADPMAGWVAL